MGDRRSAYRVFVERPEGMRQIERRTLRWENSLTMDLQKVE
jgi:hypothetical protein